MRQFKDIAISLDGLEIGSIGVILTDENIPPAFWEIDQIMEYGFLKLSRFGAVSDTCEIEAADFWRLV